MSDINPNNLSLNQLYLLCRRSLISFFGRNHYFQAGYDSADFEPAMLFLKKAYKAYFDSLVDAQKGDL